MSHCALFPTWHFTGFRYDIKWVHTDGFTSTVSRLLWMEKSVAVCSGSWSSKLMHPLQTLSFDGNNQQQAVYSQLDLVLPSTTSSTATPCMLTSRFRCATSTTTDPPILTPDTVRCVVKAAVQNMLAYLCPTRIRSRFSSPYSSCTTLTRSSLNRLREKSVSSDVCVSPECPYYLARSVLISDNNPVGPCTMPPRIDWNYRALSFGHFFDVASRQCKW